MSLSAMNSLTPVLRSRAVVNGLTTEVARDASQAQVVVQNSNAHSGSQSHNTLQENATLIQGAIGDNTKQIQVSAPAAAGQSLHSPITSPPLAVETVSNDSLSLGRATAQQDQLVAQNSFARLQNANGQPSQASNTLVQTESAATGISAGVTQYGSLQGLKAEPSKVAPPTLFSLPDAPAASEGSLNPLFQMDQVLPAGNFRTFRSVKEEQNRLASSASLLLGRHGSSYLPSLNFPSPIRSAPISLQSTATPVQSSVQTGVSAPVPSPDQLLAFGPRPIDPFQLVSPAPPSLTSVFA